MRNWLRPLGSRQSVTGRSAPPVATGTSSCGGSVAQAGRPPEASAPAPEPRRNHEQEPVGSELDPSPENENGATAVEKTIPIVERRPRATRRAALGGSQEKRDAVRPDRMPPRLHVVPSTLRNTQDAAASLKSPRALNDRARRCPPDRAATQSAPDPLLRPGEPQSRSRRPSACSPPMSRTPATGVAGQSRSSRRPRPDCRN